MHRHSLRVHATCAAIAATLALIALTNLCPAPARAWEQPDNWVGPADTQYRVLHLKVFYYGCVLMDLPGEDGVAPLPANPGEDAAAAAERWRRVMAALPEETSEAQEAEFQRVKGQLEDTRRFYWRNSRFNCLLDFEFETDYSPILRSTIATNDAPYYGPVDVEPVASARASYDGVVQITCQYAFDKDSGGLKRVRGGGGFTWGADSKKHLCPVSWWAAPPKEHVCGSDWLLCHEYGHALDSLFNESGIREHWFNHLALSEGNVARFGEHFDCMAYILRRCKEADWLALKWGELASYQDADSDSAPDADEALTLAGVAADMDPTSSDMDNDQMSDRAELLYGNGNREGHGERLHGSLNMCLPFEPDSDGDGVMDGLDEYPTLPLIGKIGMQSMPPGWLEDHVDETVDTSSFVPDPYADIFLPPDPVSEVPELDIQLGYDQDRDLTIILSWQRMDKMMRPVADPGDCELRLNFDLDNNGWFSGTDNYRIELDRDHITKVLREVADSHTDGPRDDLTAVKPEAVGFEKLDRQGSFIQVVKLTLSHELFPELACKPGEEIACNFGIRYRGHPKYEMMADPNGMVVLELR